jgi:serine/threonine protein kinase
VTVAELPVLAEGELIAGDYEVVQLISRSRALDVYDVYSESRDCRCIAKLARPDRAHEERTRRRLVDEGTLLLSLAHPHIVRAYELIEEPEPVVVLETLTGETLEHLLGRTTQPLAFADVAFLGMHLCSALHYLHARGIVHLDLKPANVVSDRGQAKLIDMSLARPPGPVSPGVGTRAYMAPEQARGGEAGPAADVWGAGAVLYEAATGTSAFRALEDGYEQLHRRAASVRELRPRLPRRIAQGIDAALDPDPAARPSVRELADALDEAVP